MPSHYGRLKNAYTCVFQKWFRNAAYRFFPFKGIYQKWLLKLQMGAEHDEIYDHDYYENLVDPPIQLSANIMVASFREAFKPGSIVDVGCGTGVLLSACMKAGIKAVGLEYSEAGLKICRQRGLDVRKFNIEQDVPPNLQSELVVSTEVAEHLPAACADRFVDLLCSIANQVVLTAALPSHSGDDHVNEQPNEYWIEKFEKRGYTFDHDLSMRWRREWPGLGVHGIYSSSVMLFRKN
jgi:SAM-dependent methyltransferase